MSASIVSEKSEQKAKRRGGRSRSTHPRGAGVDSPVVAGPSVDEGTAMAAGLPSTEQAEAAAPEQTVDQAIDQTVEQTVEQTRMQTPETLEPGAAPNSMRLEGVVDIVSAGDLKRQLIEALDRGSDLCVSLAEVSDLDVTAVQLLWAARRAARAAGVRFQVTTPPPDEILGLLAEAGLESFVLAEEVG
jgi:anti-anti-sigma regulatory factor